MGEGGGVAKQKQKEERIEKLPSGEIGLMQSKLTSEVVSDRDGPAIREQGVAAAGSHYGSSGSGKWRKAGKHQIECPRRYPGFSCCLHKGAGMMIPGFYSQNGRWPDPKAHDKNGALSISPTIVVLQDKHTRSSGPRCRPRLRGSSPSPRT